MTKKTSVLFLTKDRQAVTNKCFKSLEYLLHRADISEWLILDNNSSPTMCGWLKRFALHKTKIKLFFSKENLGVAGGRDFLLQHAQGENFLILDSDVIDKSVRKAKRCFIDTLIQALEQDDVGIVGVHGAHIAPDWSWIEPTDKTYSGFCDTITGYCQFFDRSVYDNGCRLDQVFNPYWMEDTDFSLQIYDKFGLKSYVISTNSLHHEWGKTCAGPDSNRIERWNYLVNKWRDKYIPILTREQVSDGQTIESNLGLHI